MKRKRKNLVVIHLESLSDEIFPQEIDQLQNLYQVMMESLVFRNFYSSATSSILALTDFLYGNDFELDQATSFDDLQSPFGYETNLYDELNNNGYRTMGIGFPKIWRDDVNNYDIWSNKGYKYGWENIYSSFQSKIRRFISENGEQPFALHVWDLRSHLAYMDSLKKQGENFIERRSLGYKGINNTVKFIFDLLRDELILKDTIVVGYGDHGDDFWSHSLNGGFCHAIEPYTNLIKTPAFIFDMELEPGNCDDLISLVDLKWTIFRLLNITSSRKNHFSGKDIFTYKNDVVYSRNFFANQIEEGRTVKLTKSYGVLNHNYNLIVTKDGLEMFFNQIEPANHNNLLDFFQKGSKDELIFNNKEATHKHFQVVMSKDQIEDIKKNYSFLLDKLKSRIELKNQIICEPEKNIFNIKYTDKFKERKYKW